MIFPAFFPLDREVFWVFCIEFFLHFFLWIERFFGFLYYFVESSFVIFSCFTANSRRRSSVRFRLRSKATS